MNERPILFSTPLIPKVLDDSKTQTRRVLRHDSPTAASNPKRERCDERLWIGVDDAGTTIFARAPADVGDRLWVREAFTVLGSRAYYRATDSEPGDCDIRWHPSIHMPRRLSRIALEVLSVRVERVQEISEEDAIAEGISVAPILPGSGDPDFEIRPKARAHFALLWDRINGERANWASNPWVLAITFRRVEQAKAVANV